MSTLFIEHLVFVIIGHYDVFFIDHLCIIPYELYLLFR